VDPARGEASRLDRGCQSFGEHADGDADERAGGQLRGDHPLAAGVARKVERIVPCRISAVIDIAPSSEANRAAMLVPQPTTFSCPSAVEI
jgi:hypothetical protein